MYGSIGQVSVVLSTLMGGVSGSARGGCGHGVPYPGTGDDEESYAPGWAAAVNCLSGLIVSTIPARPWV